MTLLILSSGWDPASALEIGGAEMVPATEEGAPSLLKIIPEKEPVKKEPVKKELVEKKTPEKKPSEAKAASSQRAEAKDGLELTLALDNGQLSELSLKKLDEKEAGSAGQGLLDRLPDQARAADVRCYQVRFSPSKKNLPPDALFSGTLSFPPAYFTGKADRWHCVLTGGENPPLDLSVKLQEALGKASKKGAPLTLTFEGATFDKIIVYRQVEESPVEEGLKAKEKLKKEESAATSEAAEMTAGDQAETEGLPENKESVRPETKESAGEAPGLPVEDSSEAGENSNKKEGPGEEGNDATSPGPVMTGDDKPQAGRPTAEEGSAVEEALGKDENKLPADEATGGQEDPLKTDDEDMNGELGAILPDVLVPLRAGPTVSGPFLPTSGKNAWQIVKRPYKGNGYKTQVGFPEGRPDVWLTKTIVPTDTENKFKVCLSISKRASWEQLLQKASFIITTSNHYHNYNIGEEVHGGIKGRHGEIWPDPGAGGRTYTATVTFYRNGRKVDTKTQKYYGDVPNANNGTGFINIDGVCFVACKSVNLAGNDLRFDVNLDAMEGAGIHYLLFPVKLEEVVEEKLNKYLPCSGGDEYVNGTFNGTAGTTSWQITEKPGVPQTTHEERGSMTGVYENVAELVYPVKLDVGQGGFNSCGENMKSSDRDPESYLAAKSSLLTYSYVKGQGQASFPKDRRQAPFPQPAVRGLLYDLNLQKVDKKFKPLTGARFKITGPKEAQIDVDTKGKASALNLPAGTYTATETVSPEVFPYTYKPGADVVFPLCYTDDPRGLESSTVNPKNKQVKGGDYYPIINEPAVGSLQVNKILEFGGQLSQEKKEAMKKEVFTFNIQLTKNGQPVSGDLLIGGGPITFDKQGQATFSLKGGESLVIENLPAGASYAVEEILGENPKYLSVSENAQGQIIENDTVTATFTNRYEEHPALPDAGGRGYGPVGLVGMILMAIAISRYCRGPFSQKEKGER
ncbi:MAG: hypothetical protein KHX08_01805 [Clostridiales bacterium]|nr:hypothetical protein [Clostridiales bacterium]